MTRRHRIPPRPLRLPRRATAPNLSSPTASTCFSFAMASQTRRTVSPLRQPLARTLPPSPLMPGKRKASPQEAAMLREYDSTDPAFSKPLPQSPVHKARSRLPRPRAGLFVYAPSSCCEGLPSAATSSNSDCGSPAGEGPEEGEVCDEPMHVGKKVCLRHEEQHLGNKMDEDDVVLGAELLVSLFGSCPV
ncbi:unnamed protein product [Closterium sp. Naga37s-1]|nr:unnamed protein product [Closterium sp. Naga37s-1]